MSFQARYDDLRIALARVFAMHGVTPLTAKEIFDAQENVVNLARSEGTTKTDQDWRNQITELNNHLAKESAARAQAEEERDKARREVAELRLIAEVQRGESSPGVGTVAQVQGHAGPVLYTGKP